MAIFLNLLKFSVAEDYCIKIYTLKHSVLDFISYYIIRLRQLLCHLSWDKIKAFKAIKTNAFHCPKFEMIIHNAWAADNKSTKKWSDLHF